MVHAWLPTLGFPPRYVPGRGTETRWMHGDGHHCCSVTAGEGTHELSVPAALREMLLLSGNEGFLGGFLVPG